jgi:S1-C subfamily serine protease
MILKIEKSLERIISSIENDVLNVVTEWIQILKAMDPDIDKMSPIKIANYYFVTGQFKRAKEIIESMVTEPEGLSEEAFQLLLKCLARMCLIEEYRNVHKKYGSLFKLIYPDFNRLDSFLKSVDDSVYMIQVQSQMGTLIGSGFSIASDLIVTNRHVVENANAQTIRAIGKNKILIVSGVEVDPINDIAILEVKENLIPFRLGESNFVAPGEQVLALGFPSPSSNIHGENIYISRGIINSIRNIDVSPERVMFIDAKIGRGMSGGPLINDLGEVIGIITLIRYEVEQSDKGAIAIGDQPVALPIDLVRNYLIKHQTAHKT